MFDTHAKRIAEYAQSGPDAFAHVLEFVILTVQMPLYRVPRDLKELQRKRSKSKALWGWKRAAYEHVHANKASIYADAMSMYRSEDAEKKLLAYFANQPGFGLVKGGFVLQLAFGLGGCLDTHNVARFGLNTNAFRADRVKAAKTAETKEKAVSTYQGLLQKCGGCRKLWNDWCSYVAEQQPSQYKDAFHVSALHCEALGL